MYATVSLFNRDSPSGDSMFTTTSALDSLRWILAIVGAFTLFVAIALSVRPPLEQKSLPLWIGGCLVALLGFAEGMLVLAHRSNGYATIEWERLPNFMASTFIAAGIILWMTSFALDSITLLLPELAKRRSDVNDRIDG